MHNNIPLDGSDIIRAKFKFFLNRAIVYFAFLLVPVWTQKCIEMDLGTQSLTMLLYMAFMAGQWFLLGKEIDYRLKIYFRVNSSVDRIIYRLLLGMAVLIIYFNLLFLLPTEIIKHFFWGTWISLGLFYSWPTRGKIIKESVTTHLGEFTHLDSFEKTLLFLIIILFIVSIPQLGTFDSIDAVKFNLDPSGKISDQLWNFLYINYFPFKKFPRLFSMAFNLHVYVVFMGTFLLSFYALLRFIVCRRLALLGVFSLLSSWAFAQFIYASLALVLPTTFSVIWIWSLLWVVKSATYRSGLFLGIIIYIGTLLHASYFLLLIPHFVSVYYLFLRDKTSWYKKQLLKYTAFGVGMAILTLLLEKFNMGDFYKLDFGYFSELAYLVGRKAFFSLSFFGVLVLPLFLVKRGYKLFSEIKIQQSSFQIVVFSFASLIIFSLFFDSYVVRSFSGMVLLATLSLIPIEILFQTLSKLRSSRNMIYLIYILVCLLDSHFEGRVKVFFKMF